MDDIMKILSKFPDREAKLRSVTRYSLYDVMWYRTDLWTHSRRVGWIIEKLIPLAEKSLGPAFDPKKALSLGLVHDDAETIFGDIQAGHKEKMSLEELAGIKQLERDAIDTLVETSPKYVGKYEYKMLLLGSLEKPYLESIVVALADKIDGFCEALHEIFAGNALWTVNAVNKYGVMSLPTDHHIEYFKNFLKKFPLAAPFIKETCDIFELPDALDVKNIVKNGSPHTAQSICQKTGLGIYDFWRELTIEKGNKEDVSNLYIRKE